MKSGVSFFLFLCLFLLVNTTSFSQPVFRWADALTNSATASTGDQNQVLSMFVNKRGDVYVVGNFITCIDMDPGPGLDSLYHPVYVATLPGYIGKYDSSGHLIWGHDLGLGGAAASAIDDSGYYYIAGSIGGVDTFGLGFSLDTCSVPGFFLAKYDSSDHLVWLRATAASDGEIFSIKADHSGNVYVAGQFNGPVDFDPAHPGTVVFGPHVLDGFLAKYAPDGSFVWARQIAGNDGDRGFNLDLDPTGNVLMTGYTGGTFPALYGPTPFGDTGGVYRLLALNGNNDAFVAKYNPDGAVIWLKAIGGPGNDFGYGIVTDSRGNVYASGYYDTWMVADSATHDTLNAGVNNTAGYLIKFGAAGNFIWAKSYGCDTGTVQFANAVALAKDDTDNIYLTGTFETSVQLNPAGPGVRAQGGVVAAGEDYYVLKLDSAGHYKWAIHTFSKRDDETACIFLDHANNIYVAGYITDTTDFNIGGPGGEVGYPIPYTGWEPTSFFAKYQQPKAHADTVADTVSKVPTLAGGLHTVFPNPVNDQLTITGSISSNAGISVVDMLGAAYDIPAIVSQGKVVLFTRSLVPGMYIVQCTDPGQAPFRAKFVKE